MDDRALARWRLHTQRLVGRTFPSPEAVVAGLLGVQAENHPQASWAVAARTATGSTTSSFAALFDAGVILRTHVLRPTWHYVRPDDIRWLLELTAPRVRRSFRQLQQQLGVDEASLGRARDVVTGSLTDGVHLTRAALGERLHAAGLPSDGPGLMLVMADAELAGLVCSGTMQGGQHTYALLDERAPGARRLGRDEAVAELMLVGVVGEAVLPAAPDDADPGSGEDADGVGVAQLAGSGSGVDVCGPGGGVAAVVGEVDDRVAQLLVAREPERDRVQLPGAAGGGRDPGQGGQRVVGGEASAGVTDLGQQGGGAHDPAFGQRGEDVRVGVELELFADLVFEQVDAAVEVPDRLEQGAGDQPTGLTLDTVESAGRGGEVVVELLAGLTAAVALPVQPRVEPLR
jgi:hypothetical protein